MLLKTPPIKVAFGSVPKDSGTFTFYRNIKAALSARNVEMYCVTVGWAQSQLWEDAYADEGCVLLAPASRSMKNQAKAFVQWCEDNDIDIVMGINSEGILSAIPHLPGHIRAMARCANAFDHGYKITMSGRERLARIIALTPRLRDDLVADYGADADKIELIPNGIEAEKFDDAAGRIRGRGARLELGFLGRLEHNQKGVMYLPEIVSALNRHNVDFRLRIAGKGVDRGRLEEAMKDDIASGRVELLGALEPKDIPGFLGETDCYLFTSHFEGCPNALLEAMMAGCIPISWTIHGITDYLIDHGRTGFLCETGDTECFARTIVDLASERTVIAQLSGAVAKEARARFTDEIAAGKYAKVFQDLMDEPAPFAEPRPWNSFKPDPNFPQYWRLSIPQRVKQIVRRAIGKV